MKVFFSGTIFLALLGLGAAAFVRLGFYDISATDQHLAPTYWLLDTGMKYSVRRRAKDIAVPDLLDDKKISQGLALYRRHCEHCHGAPGVAPAPFALGMTPAPVPLVHTARAWRPAEIFWVVKEGIKMTGMPAWKHRMSDEEIWTVVAFLPAMARMTPQQYKQQESNPPGRIEPSVPPTPAAGRGRKAIEQYGCVTCHAIPGVVGPNFPVGPPLGGVGSRTMLGGVLPNSPENMVRWLRAPQEFAPLTAMPNLGLTERDARDIAAFLATLK
ncbi:MAG: c-type cytochrome, partial [Betaproteobacteria bacterium]